MMATVEAMSERTAGGSPFVGENHKLQSSSHLEESRSGVAQEDPIFQDLMIHSPKSTLPLHNYYSEFRLGQGDPLLKAAMVKWPNTTTESAFNTTDDERLKKRKRQHKRLSDCTDLGAPLYDHTFWFFNDIVHIDKHKLVGLKAKSGEEEESENKERRDSI
jgi:hypothetical protein